MSPCRRKARNEERISGLVLSPEKGNNVFHKIVWALRKGSEFLFPIMTFSLYKQVNINYKSERSTFPSRHETIFNFKKIKNNLLS